MGQEPDTPSGDLFLQLVRSALTHLYDPDYLRQSRLAEYFGVGARFDTPTALQRILTEAVESLRRAPGQSPGEQNRDLYELLMYRYIQQFSQDEVAHQLGLSVRQLRRRQNAAVYAVASSLWERFALAASGLATELAPEGVDDAPALPGDSTEGLVWLTSASDVQQTDLSIALPTIFELIAPLAHQHHMNVVADGASQVQLAVHPVAFQQTLLHLLSLAIRQSHGPSILLTIREAGTRVVLHVQSSFSATWQPTAVDEAALAVTERVVTLCNGQLRTATIGDPFWTELAFPVLQQIEVMVIEDNVEIIDVMRRHTAGTRFRIHAVNDPQSALLQAEVLQPDVIILDIMMPQIDGLQVLAKLKRHAKLSTCPVIVCSVFPQADLATALGAAAYVAKPFKQNDLLEALQRVLSPVAQAPPPDL